MQIQKVYNQTKEQDIQLNKLVQDITCFSLVGLGAGLCLCFFAKKKLMVTQMSMGVGAGIAFNRNYGGRDYYLGFFKKSL